MYSDLFTKIKEFFSRVYLFLKNFVENTGGFKIWSIVAGSVLFFVLFIYIFIFSAPFSFKKGTVIVVEKGATLLAVSDTLKKDNIICSPFWFRVFVTAMDSDKGAVAGEYIFHNRENIISVANRIVKGNFGFAKVKVTIPEGLNSMEIGDLLEEKLFNFNRDEFVKIAKKYEGKLFPNTYFFAENEKPQNIVSAMILLFDAQIKSLNKEIKTFGKSLDDVIKMASIVEEEGRTMETRRMIAGILWRRLSINMPLQVDATFKYINGKDSSNLTTADLQIDSPYNLHNRRGLPPTAISNPGLDAIKATVTPIKTNYLYFLTDKNGKMHYAVSFEEHKLNKERYLR